MVHNFGHPASEIMFIWNLQKGPPTPKNAANVSIHTYKPPAADALPFSNDNRVHRDYGARPARFGPVAIRALAVGGVYAGRHCGRVARLGCGEVP